MENQMFSKSKTEVPVAPYQKWSCTGPSLDAAKAAVKNGLYIHVYVPF